MIIGITGNSGSGKTYVSKILAEKLGYKLIDADKIVYKLSMPGEKFYSEIVNTFGEEVLNDDKTLNRKLIADIIFNSKQKKNKMDKLTFQYVKREIEKNMEKNTILDAPLLFESGLDKLCDITITVIAEEIIKLERISKRDNITQEKAKERLNAQTKEEILKEQSTYVIENNEKNNAENEIQKIINTIIN